MSRNLCQDYCANCGHYRFNEEDITEVFNFMKYYEKVFGKGSKPNYLPTGYGFIDNLLKGEFADRYEEPEKRYAYSKVVCPLCNAMYLTWLRWDLCAGEWNEVKKRFEGGWEVYDLSYWYSYNDETCDKDEKRFKNYKKRLRLLGSDEIGISSGQKKVVK